MITCPWCGTSYSTFQPSCGKCGGPLPAPRETKIGRPPPPFEPPPPAPRPFNEQYAKFLMQGDYKVNGLILLAIAGLATAVFSGMFALSLRSALVFLPFVLIGLGMIGYSIITWRKRLAEKQPIIEVLRDGMVAMGKITRIQEITSVDIGGRHPWEIHYEFHASTAEPVKGSAITMKHALRRYPLGCDVYVLYLPGDPSRNTLYPVP